MIKVNREPWEIASMDELLALARAMEQESIDHYIALATRMREMERPDLALVFEVLVAEETEHLEQIEVWEQTSGQGHSIIISPPEAVFDDEGTETVPAELLSAYRAFSLAVRNEERAFNFWTYVAANAKSDEIAKAAERMAHEELTHVARLRQQRRRAFHLERAETTNAANLDLPALENRLSELLYSLAQNTEPSTATEIRALAAQAEHRSSTIDHQPFQSVPGLEAVPNTASNEALPLCELLTDYYLELGQTARKEEDQKRALAFASETIALMRMIRQRGRSVGISNEGLNTLN